jgi:hypothetical protein
MGKLFSIVLILLGVLAARDFISGKVPASRKLIDSLYAYADYLGITGIIFGILWILIAISMLHLITVNLFLVLEVWLGALLLFAVGLIFGYGMSCKMAGEPIPGWLAKVGTWRDRLLPHQKELGLASIVIGVIYLL